MMTQPKRVLAIASGGGHWVQLLRMREAFDGASVAYATTSPDSAQEVPGSPFFVVPDATRWNRWALVKLTVSVMWLLLRLRPQVVVTTGAAPGLIAIAIGHALGMRTVWVDSIANVDGMSLSGQSARRFADLWLTQWEHLAAEPGGPSFRGAVL